MRISVANRQRVVKVDLTALRGAANKAASRCLECPGSREGSLPELAEVEISILDDRRIAEVNEEFLSHEGPTDVITFDYGEILVSAETALENSRRFGKSVQEELILYIIHGLLHLNGWSDKHPLEAERMQVAQESVLSEILSR